MRYSLPQVKDPVRHYFFKPKDYIPLEEDILWQIERGVVRTLTWSEDGVQMLLGFWTTGDIIGTPVSTIKSYGVECMSMVAVKMVPRDSWNQTYKTMMGQLKRSEELLCILNGRSMRLRLRQFLAWLSARFGSPFEHGILINLKLTHQDIADSIGSTRVTVTRLLSELKKEDLISIYKNHFIVLKSESR